MSTDNRKNRDKELACLAQWLREHPEAIPVVKQILGMK